MPTKKEIEFIRQIHDRITEHMIHKNDELVKPKIADVSSPFELILGFFIKA